MIERPSLEEAARSWLRKNEDLSPAEEVLKQALTDFVEKRFRGAAEELRRVHAIRHRLLDDPRPLRTLANLPYRDGDDETLALAASSSAPTDQGRLLFHLVRAFQPEKVLELGTNLGVSAAYIALGLRFAGKGRLTTIERSLVRLEQARSHLAEVGTDNVDLVEGDFDEVLSEVLDRLDHVDMAFLDGNHRYDATLRYFEMIRPRMSGGVMVLDDIRWSEGMLQAWNEVIAHPSAETVVDLGRTGIVVLAGINPEDARSPRRRSILRRRS